MKRFAIYLTKNISLESGKVVQRIAMFFFCLLALLFLLFAITFVYIIAFFCGIFTSSQGKKLKNSTQKCNFFRHNNRSVVHFLTECTTHRNSVLQDECRSLMREKSELKQCWQAIVAVSGGQSCMRKCAAPVRNGLFIQSSVQTNGFVACNS